MRHQMPLPEIIIGTHDYHDLMLLALSGHGEAAEAADDLFFKLERARLVSDPRLAPDVVRIGSTVRYQPDNGPEREVTLVYPAEADISAGKISVLTPVGTALLGLRAQQTTTWTARNGRDHVLRVLSVRQPDMAVHPSTAIEDA
jgi:regulator of nucleoside diphosphate kinase